jgi:predicted site-specific integrase-resolvase
MTDTSKPTPEREPCVSLMVAAQQLQMSYDTARRHLLQGRLRGTRVKTGWLVTEASVEALKATLPPAH